jgi:hypothetical protein
MFSGQACPRRSRASQTNHEQETHANRLPIQARTLDTNNKKTWWSA